MTYRGIFLNDEAPCLTGWVKQTYGTNYGDHRFYTQVCELILRLKGNFLWPAMWSWAFYADDPQNSKTCLLYTSEQLFQKQTLSWELAKENYQALEQYRSRTKKISKWFGNNCLSAKLFFNPKRILSATAQTDTASIHSRPCFLLSLIHILS